MLGVVRGRGQAHGYQVRRDLLAWGADQWASVAPGSIYQALRTSAKHGLLEPVGTETDAGPERTMFALTAAGQDELIALIHRAVAEPTLGDGALNAAFAFLHLLPRADVIELLDARIAELDVLDREFEQAAQQPDKGTPEQVAALVALRHTQMRADRDWTTDLAARIRAGSYPFVDDPDGDPESD